MDSLERLNFKGDGLNLVADAIGPADGPQILFLHGSGQARQSWGKGLKQAARRGYRAITLDQRGHGDSDWAQDGNYDLPYFANDLRVVLGQFDTPPIVVGASLGGLVAMLVSATDPDAMRALVLVDITARVEMDGAKEVMDFMGSAKDGFASLDEAADAVSAYLPHRPRPKDTSGLARNLRLRNGRYFWHWDPKLTSMGPDPKNTRIDPNRLQTAASALKIPTLLVRGGRSRIVSEQGAREFQELVPHAEFVDIAGAHHMVAGDANDTFNDAILDFIDRLEAAPAV